MHITRWLTSAALTFALAGLMGCAYNPALPDEPFWCGPGGKCPDGYDCYGGICGKQLPDCMNPANAEYAGWPDDSDLEPNNHPDLAVILPCGDDPVSDPTYSQRCPSRENYTNGFMNLLICPQRDRDMYKIFLMQNEVITFQVLYMYSDTLPRDLDAKVWRYDYVQQQYVEVTVGTSTNDNETVTVSTELSTGNPEGWYYLEVHGKTDADVNYYTVSFTLNPTTTTD